MSTLSVLACVGWLGVGLFMFLLWPKMERVVFFMCLWPLFILFVASWVFITSALKKADFVPILLCTWLTLGLVPSAISLTRCWSGSIPASPDRIPESAIVSRTSNYDGTQTIRYSLRRKLMADVAENLLTALPGLASMVLVVIVPVGALVALIPKRR